MPLYLDGGAVENGQMVEEKNIIGLLSRREYNWDAGFDKEQKSHAETWHVQNGLAHTHTHVKAAQFHASSVMKTKTNHFGGYRTACENVEKGRNAELWMGREKKKIPTWGNKMAVLGLFSILLSYTLLHRFDFKTSERLSVISTDMYASMAQVG